MDDEDFLDAVEADNANLTVPDKAEEPVVEPAPDTPTPEPSPAPTPEPVPTPEAKPDPGYVPINVVLDERDKRKKLEAENAQLRAQQQQPQPAAPDVWADPEGYNQFQEQKVQQALYQQNLRWSERIATSEHGAETVQKAKDWATSRCDEDPYFNAKVAASPDPIAFAVAEWQREQIASQVTPQDLTEFQAWKQAQAQIQAITPSASPTIPPRSLAGAPSAGGVMSEVAQSDDEIFGEVFSRK